MILSTSFYELIVIDEYLTNSELNHNYYASIKKLQPDYYKYSQEWNDIALMAEDSLKTSELRVNVIYDQHNLKVCDEDGVLSRERELSLKGDYTLNLLQRKQILEAHYNSITTDFGYNFLKNVAKIYNVKTYNLVVIQPAKEIAIYMLDMQEELRKHYDTLIKNTIPAHLGYDVYYEKNWGYAEFLGTWEDVENNGLWADLE